MLRWHDQLFRSATCLHGQTLVALGGSPHHCLDTGLSGGWTSCQGAGLAASGLDWLPGGWSLGTVMPGEGARKGGSLEGAMALGGTVMVPTINIQEGEEVWPLPKYSFIIALMSYLCPASASYLLPR